MGRILTGALRRLALGPVPALFDTAYYLRNAPAAAASWLDPFLHYVLRGAAEGYDPNGDFDTAFYRAQGAATRLDPLRHYVRFGAAEGFDPSPRFSTRLYLARYPDVVAAKVNPLQHYRAHGRGERRTAAPSNLAHGTPTPLIGVPAEHRWALPDGTLSGFSLTLLRGAAPVRSAASAERLCLVLALDGHQILGLAHAFAVFATGAQDAIRLDFVPDRSRKAELLTAILSFETCYIRRSDDGRRRMLDYAEARIWDLRTVRPSVLAVAPAGSLAVDRPD